MKGDAMRRPYKYASFPTGKGGSLRPAPTIQRIFIRVTVQSVPIRGNQKPPIIRGIRAIRGGLYLQSVQSVATVLF